MSVCACAAVPRRSILLKLHNWCDAWICKFYATRSYVTHSDKLPFVCVWGQWTLDNVAKHLTFVSIVQSDWKSSDACRYCCFKSARQVARLSEWSELVNFVSDPMTKRTYRAKNGMSLEMSAKRVWQPGLHSARSISLLGDPPYSTGAKLILMFTHVRNCFSKRTSLNRFTSYVQIFGPLPFDFVLDTRHAHLCLYYSTFMNLILCTKMGDSLCENSLPPHFHEFVHLLKRNLFEISIFHANTTGWDDTGWTLNAMNKMCTQLQRWQHQNYNGVRCEWMRRLHGGWVPKA